jgi:hypothetical protein
MSQTTIYNHMTGLRNFAGWYLLTSGKKMTLAEVTHEDVEDYKDHLWGAR